jgi:hypothetical protein
MTITFQPFDATGRSRVSGLINKYDPFNLTIGTAPDGTITWRLSGAALMPPAVRMRVRRIGMAAESELTG